MGKPKKQKLPEAHGPDRQKCIDTYGKQQRKTADKSSGGDSLLFFITSFVLGFLCGLLILGAISNSIYLAEKRVREAPPDHYAFVRTNLPKSMADAISDRERQMIASAEVMK